MPAIHMFLNGDGEAGKSVGVKDSRVIHTTDDWTIDVLRGGMTSGATSLMLLVPTFVGNDPVLVAAEMSLNAWMMASSALASACRDEIEKPGWASLAPAARLRLAPRFIEALRRSIPSATTEELVDAVEMILDGFGADGPEIEWPEGT